MNTLKKHLFAAAAALVAVAALSACEVPEDDGETRADREAPVAGKENKKDGKSAEKPDEPNMTTAQENAVRSANGYLDYSAFSRSGLIDQLKFEGYSVKDATFAVDHVNPDWNKQAALAAKNYLDMSGFSRQGLIEQLQFEGYTPAQAAYGAKQNGL